MIDPRARMRRDPRPEGAEDRFQRRPLRLPVMRPDRAKAEVRRPKAVQILEAALDVRIALDVVEDVSGVRRRQQVETLARYRWAKFERRSAGAAADLEPGLGRQSRQC